MTEYTLPLEGKVALVVGGGTGIGAATARAMADAGAHVAVAGRHLETLRPVVDGILAGGGSAAPAVLDVGDDESVERAVGEILAESGRLDLAVNGAATESRKLAPLGDLPLDGFDRELQITLRGTFVCMRHELRAMVAAGGGAIVNVTSTAGLQGVPHLGGYVAAKFGVVGLTATAALDYAAQGIRVNAIAPGPILTGSLATAGEQAIAGASAAVPLLRVGDPAEVAAVAVWLCSDAASFVTGATVPVDGGRLAGPLPFRHD